jgi:hypothetical protein
LLDFGVQALARQALDAQDAGQPPSKRPFATLHVHLGERDYNPLQNLNQGTIEKVQEMDLQTMISQAD